MLTIISGGQTGADRAALDAWHKLGYPTGGYAPKGYRTDNGPAPALAALGLVETDDPEYKYRTILNVEMADATLIFGRPSPGSNLTLEACKVRNKPYEWLAFPPNHPTTTQIDIAIALILVNNVNVLNVAGNREAKNPGIYRYVSGFITRLGRELSK